jgi:uncharacterized membrane protein (UPF0182 family)
VESSGKTSFPLLKKVLVAFGDQVGFADTLDEALDQVFGGDSGASAGDAENSTGDSGSTAGKSDTDKKQQSDEGSTTGTKRSAELQQALNDANQAIKDSDAALQKGDFSAYGEAQQRLKEAVNKAVEAQNNE